MRIAVTGGAGFIGSHVVDRLVDDGHEVVVIDLRPPHRRDVDWFDVDLLSLPGLVRATRDCEVVFHLAAMADVNEVFAYPTEAAQVNVVGTAQVWEACRRNQVRRAVLASTVWVYSGTSGEGPLTEDMPFVINGGGHVYTTTKLASEMLVHDYASLYGQEFTILRYGIPYGPRMRDNLVIARFLRMALAAQPITVHGDGSQFRNYVYVEDLAEAHALALGPAAVNQVFNLEGAEPVTLLRIVHSIRALVDHPVAVEFLPARTGDYAGREVSADKARAVLAWAPRTSFEDGLRRYAEWVADDEGGAGAGIAEAAAGQGGWTANTA
jgi:UDP-glucose 4-epimerase